MIAEGTYTAKAADGTGRLTKSGTKGTPQVEVVLDLPDAGERITWIGYLTPKTEERTLESLEHLGWKGTDIAEVTGLDQEVEVVVEHEEYDGKTRARVKWVNRKGGGAGVVGQKLSGAEEKQLRDHMKAKVLAMRAGKGQRPAANTKPQRSEPEAEEDIPF